MLFRSKIFGMGKEFTRGDKFIYLAAYTWTFLWVMVFVVGTVFNLSGDVPNSSWMAFWKYFVMINLSVSVVIIIWFAIGGVKDFKDMLYRLKTMVRDHDDDGTVKQQSVEETIIK